jgi:hypothetical protein
MSVCTFAGIFSHQLIHQSELLSHSDQPYFSDDIETALSASAVTDGSPMMAIFSLTAADVETIGKTIIRQLEDANNKMLFLVKYKTTTDPSGQKYSKARACKVCKEQGIQRDTIYYCIACGLGCS